MKKKQQGDYEGAIKEAEEALSKVGAARFNNEGFLPMGPEWNRRLDDDINRIEPASRCLMSEAEYKLGKYDAAIKDADTVIDYCNDKSTWQSSCSEPYQYVVLFRGASYFNKKNYPAAKKDFLWLRDASEKLQEEAALFLAAAYANQGKYNAAIVEADKVIAMRGAHASKAAALKQEVNRMRSR